MGGSYSSDTTATAADVKSGKTYIGSDTNDNVGTGTLKLKRMLVGTWDRRWGNSGQDFADYVQYFNCTSVPDYKNKTAADFSIEFTYVAADSSERGEGFDYTPTKTYNASTGQLGVSGLLSKGHDGWYGMSVSKGNVYAYYI